MSAHRTLSALADALLPARSDLPGAGELDLESAFTVRPDLREPAERGLARLGVAASGDDRALRAAFTRLARQDAEAHAVLALVVCSVYYADARVCAAIGYHGPDPAEQPDLASEDVELRPLIARVAARGPRFRDVAASTQA